MAISTLAGHWGTVAEFSAIFSKQYIQKNDLNAMSISAQQTKLKFSYGMCSRSTQGPQRFRSWVLGFANSNYWATTLHRQTTTIKETMFRQIGCSLCVSLARLDQLPSCSEDAVK